MRSIMSFALSLAVVAACGTEHSASNKSEQSLSSSPASAASQLSGAPHQLYKIDEDYARAFQEKTGRTLCFGQGTLLVAPLMFIPSVMVWTVAADATCQIGGIVPAAPLRLVGKSFPAPGGPLWKVTVQLLVGDTVVGTEQETFDLPLPFSPPVTEMNQPLVSLCDGDYASVCTLSLTSDSIAIVMK